MKRGHLLGRQTDLALSAQQGGGGGRLLDFGWGVSAVITEAERRLLLSFLTDRELGGMTAAGPAGLPANSRLADTSGPASAGFASSPLSRKENDHTVMPTTAVATTAAIIVLGSFMILSNRLF